MLDEIGRITLQAFAQQLGFWIEASNLKASLHLAGLDAQIKHNDEEKTGLSTTLPIYVWQLEQRIPQVAFKTKRERKQSNNCKQRRTSIRQTSSDELAILLEICPHASQCSNPAAIEDIISPKDDENMQVAV
jgi:hypothetical protein